ncbi:MAG TPA: hypothetical protein VG734_05310 [Lacunisphaera sp.]|nr:hypothetical protein [Lacunisphaera sp.]
MATLIIATSVRKRRARPSAGKDLPRIYLLSPANMAGLRAKMLLNPRAPFPLARKFREEGVPLAEVFSFTSGLYFRGKITYARHFAHATRRDIIRVITSNAGLLDPDTLVRPKDIMAFGRTDIDPLDPKYNEPLRRDALRLAERTGRGPVIFLGSIATPKYRQVLLDVFGDRLMFPVDFVGRGDMSRGGLLLRAVREGRELPYQEVADAVYTGPRAVRISEISL